MRFIVAALVLGLTSVDASVPDAQCTRQSLGCWTDAAARAISGGIRFNSVNVDDCQKYAADRGYAVFAVQYNSECFTAEDAEATYNKYGVSTACAATGRGGGWANNVYKVSCVGAGTWSKNAGKYLSGYSAGTAKYDSLLKSQSECIKRSDCGGITYETISKKFTLRRGVDLKDSPSSEISWLAISSDDEGGHIFAAKGKTDYELHKALAVGDVISAFGQFKDHTTSKFNLNIKGPRNLFLIHVDFRPWTNMLVLNSNQPGVGWQAEVRPAFPKEKLVGGKIFKVSVEVLEGEYRILYNDEEVGKFPQRQSISLASHIVLYGGSNGFEWKAAQLPPGVAGPGLSKPCGTGDKVHFDKTPEVGDIITVWGIFADKTSAFSVNLIKDDGNFMLHISFRPPPSENKIVLNSKLNGAWQSELRAAMPAFVQGGPFKVQIELLLNEFKIYVNGNDIGVSFPYREGFSLGDIQFLYNVGGSNGMTFTDMSPPDDKNVGVNLMSTSLAVSQNSVGWGGVPARAIDGNRNGQWGAATCTHSAGNVGNWWKVELGQMSAINRVVIYNRLDCCSDRINGAKVYAGVNFCGEVKYEAGKAAFTVECGGAIGDSLRISQPYNYLTLCEVEIYGKPSDLKALANVAPGKPTWQSSVGWGGVPQRATDGRINGLWPKGTCTHSANAGSNLWKVDLLDMFNVDSVVIYNRLDCCSERINGAKVYVGNELCGAVEYVAGQSVYKIDCGGKVGSAIKIAQDGQYLTLCEVQVLATPSDDLGTFLNVAADGKASQSNTGWNGVADRAIDGNIAGDYFDGASCSHTGNTVDGYWKLDFDDAVAVKQVVIYNREDCCADRINGVTVFAGDTLCGKINYIEGQKAYKVGCKSDTVNMFESVTIKAAPNQYLTLCEVKVLADPRVESGDEHLANLAFGKPTSQSSTGWGGVSSRAVDGKEAGKWTAGSCTHTNGAGWWNVDLKDNYVVKNVWIKNRVDCCSNRIEGVKVYVGDALCGTIKYNPLKYSYNVNCGENGIVGSSVKVVNSATHLTLCEVKVWGPAEPVVIEQTTDEEVVGDKSAAVDDAVSQAKCPSGKVVSFCEVATGNTAVNADGALVKGDGGELCVAHNGYGGQGVIARAICSEQVQIASPCNGPKLNLYKKLYARGNDPSLKCPAGYEAVICNAHSFWWNMLVNKVDAKGIISNDKDCVVPSCNANNWCDITLVCKLVEDMDAYAAAVCPSCDGYNCEEGFECQMVDDDGDDSDKKFPTCVEKQTGCDVDRCGDNGDCEPKGADDYICICSDGYEFDEIAGTCMPIHTKYRTVYGDEAIGDDAHSYATCKEGERVYRCHTYGAPSAADGVTIANTNGLVRCEARASHSKKFPVRAVAYCGEDNIVTDPCTQDDVHQIEYRIDAGLSPSITCPDGYLMESCIFHSPWTQALTDVNRALINSIGAVGINDDGSCSMTDCLKNPHGHQWCKLTAVCKKLTGSEYMAAACPTCDDVRCPEGQECGMVEELPLCLPRVPGGCEADKCGENGECKEDGTDYECVCKTGYKFDSVTCIDIDECAEEPCGNGDCTNTAGSYSCDCKKGYEAVKGTCEDVDECADSPCSETERCSNIEGSFICDCLDTFIRVKKSKECVCADGYENQDGACADIDECALADSCGENEVCTNSVGNFQCECKEGTEKGSDGVCKEFTPMECDVKPKKPIVKGIKGTNVNVKLAGEVKKTFKKYATIKWEKNNEPWDPKSDGKAKFNGFTIRKFDAEDAGIYVASIYIEKDGESFKCDVEVKLVLLEGSVKLNIANAKQLSKKQKAGTPLTIKCDVDIDNLKLKDPKSPDNINWYKVTDDGDELLDDSDTISIERGKGTYQMILKNPTPEDSGTYRCEFDQQGVDTSTDVTIEIK